MKQLSLNDGLKSKNVLLGCCIMYPVAGIIERIGPDWDWIWIDAQHGLHDYNSILECVRACERAGVPSVVRVPSHECGTIGMVLDTCASGVMVPMVNTAKQAMEVARASKFPPEGLRSYGGRRPVDLYGRSYSHYANRDVLLIAQIETEEGLLNVDEIASVPGIDALFFGPDDMAMQHSMPMDQPRDASLFRKAMEEVAAAAKKAGKIAGTVTATEDMLGIAMETGFRLCVGTGDFALLAAGSRKTRDNLISQIRGTGEGTVQ